VIKPLDVVRATVTGFQTGRMRRAAVAAGLHPDHDLLAEAENARRQAAAVADALRVENAELRAERDTSAPAAMTGSGSGASRCTRGCRDRLTQVQAELAEARQDAERLTGC
jgi:small-conductance mechanosensitive channel